MNEMTIPLRTDGGQGLYEQIYEHMKKTSKLGSFSPGRGFPLRVLWRNICR